MGRLRYRVADVLGMALALAQPARVAQCAANHARLDPTLNPAAAKRRAFASYREFMRTSFDFVWEYAISPPQMDAHFIERGAEHALEAIERHGGGVIALVHYGSWDVAAACALRLQIPITTVMTTVGGSDLATRIAAWARRQQDLEVLMTRRAATGLLRAARHGRCDAILCDIPDGGQRAIVNFCNGKVAFSTAPAWIARTVKVPLLAAHCWRENGRYILRAYPPVPIAEGDSDAEIMQRVAATLEPQIRRMPDQWYPFGVVYAD